MMCSEHDRAAAARLLDWCWPLAARRAQLAWCCESKLPHSLPTRCKAKHTLAFYFPKAVFTAVFLFATFDAIVSAYNACMPPYVYKEFPA